MKSLHVSKNLSKIGPTSRHNKTFTTPPPQQLQPREVQAIKVDDEEANDSNAQGFLTERNQL